MQALLRDTRGARLLVVMILVALVSVASLVGGYYILYPIITRVPTTGNFKVDTISLTRVTEQVVAAVTVTNFGDAEILALEITVGNETVRIDLDQPIKAGKSRGVYTDLVGECLPHQKYTFTITAIYSGGPVSKVVPDVICKGTISPPPPPPPPPPGIFYDDFELGNMSRWNRMEKDENVSFTIQSEIKSMGENALQVLMGEGSYQGKLIAEFDALSLFELSFHVYLGTDEWALPYTPAPFVISSPHKLVEFGDALETRGYFGVIVDQEGICYPVIYYNPTGAEAEYFINNQSISTGTWLEIEIKIFEVHDVAFIELYVDDTFQGSLSFDRDRLKETNWLSVGVSYGIFSLTQSMVYYDQVLLDAP